MVDIIMPTSAAVEKKVKVEIVNRAANLSIKPDTLPVDEGHYHISLGDLHGNAMKLIYTLIEEGFLEISEIDYSILYKIYNTPVDELTRVDLDIFKGIIQSAKVNKERAITLIGDELADRGKNDIFMLLMLKKLHEEDLDVDILLSNHSVDFITIMRGIGGIINYDQTNSVRNMLTLRERGIISDDEINNLIAKHYIPLVKALNYTLSDDGKLTIFSHAPVGLETVEALAKKFKVDYDEKDQCSLIRTIDQINLKINRLFADGVLVDFLLEEEVQAIKAGALGGTAPISLEYPLMRLVWNRGLGPELRTKTKDGAFEVNFVHGHIGPNPLMNSDGTPVSTHQNLDNLFGKGEPFTIANPGSHIEHLTRRSPDTTIKTFKNQLDMILDEIKVAGFKEMDPLIEEQRLAIANATEKAFLQEIKIGLEATLAPLVLNILRIECQGILAELEAYGAKITAGQKLAVDTAEEKTVLQEIKGSLEAKLNPFVLKLKTEIQTILADITKYHFEGMESFIRAQIVAIDQTKNQADLQGIKTSLEEKLTQLTIYKLRTRSYAIMAGIKRYPTEGMEAALKMRAQAIDQAKDIPTLTKIHDELQVLKANLDNKRIELIIRTQINGSRIEASASLGKLLMHSNNNLKKFLIDHQLAINSAMKKMSGEADLPTLQKVVRELTAIRDSIAAKKEELDSARVEDSRGSSENKDTHAVATFKEGLRKGKTGENMAAGAIAKKSSNKGPT